MAVWISLSFLFATAARIAASHFRSVPIAGEGRAIDWLVTFQQVRVVYPKTYEAAVYHLEVADHHLALLSPWSCS